MDHYEHIHDKLKGFIRKYYTNEIIKGSILFLSFGLLYLIFTLVVEYFLWLKPLSRTILFWLFIAIEAGLLFRFILHPLLKLAGLGKTLTEKEASRIIGSHFKEVDDKLLNILQLREGHDDTDLLVASIEQKSAELENFAFKRAINFKANTVYLKYLLIPALIWVLIWMTGNKSLFTQSFNRVVHHQTVFIPPAPFYFEIVNENLETVEDKSFVLKFRTVGDVVPDDIRIVYQGQSYFVNSAQDNLLQYIFEFPDDDIEFYLQGNNVVSPPYRLKVLAAPKIIDFGMQLSFPSYLKKEPETISNTGNATVPAGTEINWVVLSQNTENVEFLVPVAGEDTSAKPTIEKMKRDEKGTFSITKKIDSDMRYEIRSSNTNLKDYERLSYALRAVKDEYPNIFVRSDIDSVKRAPVQFLGQLTDDYGLSRLQVVAKNLENGVQSIGQIEIGQDDFEEFFYVFPDGILLEEGHSYEVYFEIFDNDGIGGPKKSVSQSFFYKNKTSDELEDEILQEQKQGIDNLEKSKETRERMEKSLDEFSEKLKNKENTDWNDKKKLDEFLKRQKSYQEMMDKQVDKMQENLNELEDDDNPSLQEKRQDLKNRYEELKAFKEKEDLIRELEKLAEKLQKEDLIERIDKLKEQSKQEQRSLERILELTKQFYVEKKTAKLAKELEELSEEQLKLSTDEKNSASEQEKLNQKFDNIQEDFEDLREQNKQLKNPIELIESRPDEKLIEMDMKEAEKSLETGSEKEGAEQKKEVDKAKGKQREASKRMKELGKKMEAGLMEMEMQGMEENIEDLQQILKNLLVFSLDQEELMVSFEEVDDRNADFPEKLKEQVLLKDYFEHIDDSLYTLSLRMVKLSSKIQEDLSSAHYNLDKSLENIAENRIQQGRTNQQYTMTAANNLADLLSDMLQNLQNQQPGSGKGKGKEGELSLPDIIKQQKDMMQKIKEGMDSRKGQGKKGKEELTGEQFQMYQEQKMIRDQLQQLMDEQGSGGTKGKSVMQQMEILEKILLEKGVGSDALQRMQQLEHELLELENAGLTRNKDTKREATSGKQIPSNRNINELELNYQNRQSDELLRRKRLEMSPEYRKKVKKYFEIEKL